MEIGRVLKVHDKLRKKYSAVNKKMDSVPGDCIIFLAKIEELELQGNHLTELPDQFSVMDKLRMLNLGSNRFEIVPDVIRYLKSLEKLSLYNNEITALNVSVLENLQQHLQLLNLNNNKLTEIPSAIGTLSCLTNLSLDNNQLTSLPDEICNLAALQELRINFNRLQYLPHLFGNLVELRILNASGNRLRELPETFGNLVSLCDLDVAGNCIAYFPNNFDSLKLREFYCEHNSLIPYEPVFSYQEPVVFSLKELAARVLLKELRKRGSKTARMVFRMPKVYELLSAAGQCTVCHQYFLHTWLECVHFVDSRSVMGTVTNAGRIPVRAQVCSYKCFNSRSHDLYGVARL